MKIKWTIDRMPDGVRIFGIKIIIPFYFKKKKERKKIKYNNIPRKEV